jgi:hypothetical protein
MVVVVGLTDHARERCAQMGISTKLVKRVLSDPDITYQPRTGEWFARRDDIIVPFTLRRDGKRTGNHRSPCVCAAAEGATHVDPGLAW